MGQSGAILWRLCEAYGYSREQVWVSNAALCAPRDIKLVSGAKLDIEYVKDLSTKACRKRLVYELRWVTQDDPNAVIVAIGKLALRSLGNRKNMSIFNYRGSVMPIDLKQLWTTIQSEKAGW